HVPEHRFDAKPTRFLDDLSYVDRLRQLDCRRHVDHQVRRSQRCQLLTPATDVELEELHLRRELSGEVLSQRPDNWNRNTRDNRNRRCLHIDRGRRRLPLSGVSESRSLLLCRLGTGQRLRSLQQSATNRDWKRQNVERITANFAKLCPDPPPPALPQRSKLPVPDLDSVLESCVVALEPLQPTHRRFRRLKFPGLRSEVALGLF